MAQSMTETRGVELPPAGTYDLDVSHTELAFVARHMQIGRAHV